MDFRDYFGPRGTPVTTAPVPAQGVSVSGLVGVAALLGIGWLIVTREDHASEDLEDLEGSPFAPELASSKPGLYFSEDLAEAVLAPELATRGGRVDLPGHSPVWVEDLDKWEQAKHAVKPYWGNYAEPWAVVTHVYENMGGRVLSR